MNKVVIITGGSSGIGKALAQEFGKRGYRILLTGRSLESLEKTVSALCQQGVEVQSFQGDVSVEQDNKKMVEVALKHYGKIDVLINNAGISMRALFTEVDLRVIKKVMDINFYGALYATFYCLPHLIKNKGTIIGISSIAGYRGLPARVGYSASKFALNGFLEALRTELLKKEVHVLTACPGFTQSNIRAHSLTKEGTVQGASPRDEGRMMTAETCAHHIYKAFIKRKKTLVLTRQGKLVVWLNKWLPGLTDRLVYRELAKEENSPLENA